MCFSVVQAIMLHATSILNPFVMETLATYCNWPILPQDACYQSPLFNSAAVKTAFIWQKKLLKLSQLSSVLTWNLINLQRVFLYPLYPWRNHCGTKLIPGSNSTKNGLSKPFLIIKFGRACRRCRPSKILLYQKS